MSGFSQSDGGLCSGHAPALGAEGARIILRGDMPKHRKGEIRMEKINPSLCSSFPLPLYWRARAPVGSEPVLWRRLRMGLWVPCFLLFFGVQKPGPIRAKTRRESRRLEQGAACSLLRNARRAEARSGCSCPERTGPAVSTAVASGRDIAAATKRRPQPATGN